jgi:PDDEXK-like uncharacterized protein DUF3799
MSLSIGIHDNVPASEYHADPCERPSLSASIAKILLAATPRHAWTAHPRLNPDFKPDNDSKFDLGTVAHEIILSRGGGFQVVDAADWTTKVAKAKRDRAREEGKTPILARQHGDAVKMSVAVGKRLMAIHETRFLQGHSERVGVWQDIGGALCRMMIDFQGPTELELWDLKTTALPLDDDSLDRWIESTGHDLQMGFYLRGAAHLWPELAGRFRWRWIIVEDHPPFEVRVKEPSPAMVEIADRKAALAIEKWRRCMEANDWPGYPPVVTYAEPTDWGLRKWERRELADDDVLSSRPMSKPLPSQAKELPGPC